MCKHFYKVYAIIKIGNRLQKRFRLIFSLPGLLESIEYVSSCSNPGQGRSSSLFIVMLKLPYHQTVGTSPQIFYRSDR